MAKKYASLTTLQNLVDNIKNIFATKTDVNTELAKKADSSHTHTIANVTNLQSSLDAKVPTSRTVNGKALTTNISLSASDVGADTKGSAAAVQENLDTVSDTLDAHTDSADIHVTTANKTNWNSAYTHSTSAHARADATKVADSTTNGNILINGAETNVYSHPNSGVTAGTYKSVTVNAQGHVTGGSNPTTLAGYGITDAETKSDASSKLTEAKTYADNAATKVKNDLLNNAGAAYDTLKELGDLIVDNADAIEALETIASGKANATHTHAISDVSGLQTALDGKAASSHGTHVSYSTTAPVMDGTAAVGTATTVARSDHKHPTDTSRASKTEFDTHNSDTTKHITSTERTNWNAAKTHADSAHAPSNAEKNQNAFSNVKVGTTTIAADTTTDTLTLEGSNVTITPDATNDKITFAVADGSTSAKGVVQLTNSTSSTSTTTAATPSSVKSAYDLANTAKTAAATAQTRADSAYSLAQGKDSVSFTQNLTSGTKVGTITINGTDTDLYAPTDTDTKVKQMVTSANSNFRLLLTPSFQTETTTAQTYFDSDVYLNPYYNKIYGADIDGNASGLDGLTATIDELNYMGGVTSSVQTQLNNKAAKTHDHGTTYVSTSSQSLTDVQKSNARSNISAAEKDHTHSTYALKTNTVLYDSLSMGRESGSSVGNCSTALGRNVVSDGPQSFASGSSATASGSTAHALGNNVTASANYSFATGYGTTASEYYAFAEGDSTTASGEASHAEGKNTIAAGKNQHVQGKYNVEDSNDKYAHIVGNGTSSNRSNAHTLDWNGNAWFKGSVYVGGTGQNDATALQVASVATMTTSEYEALETAGTTNANVLYMLTDGDDRPDLSQNDPTAADYVKGKPTAEDALNVLTETGIIEPITNENGAVFTDENGIIFVL